MRDMVDSQLIRLDLSTKLVPESRDLETAGGDVGRCPLDIAMAERGSRHEI